MKSLWSYYDDCWTEWPAVRITPRRVFIPRHYHEAQRILRGEKNATDTLYALDRVKLEREGSVFHNPDGTTGGARFYTDVGKAALESRLTRRASGGRDA